MVGKTHGENGKRTRLSPTERRAQLITLGVRMLRDHTVEDISINDIAAEAGISRGLLFHYFPTKQDFQRAVVNQANVNLLARTAPDRSLTLPEMLRASVQHYVEYVEENRNAYLGMLRGPASASPEVLDLVDQTRNAIVDLILGEVESKGAMGLPADDPQRPRVRLAVRGWIAFVEEITLSWLRAATITRPELIDLLVDSLPALAQSPTLAVDLQL